MTFTSPEQKLKEAEEKVRDAELSRIRVEKQKLRSEKEKDDLEKQLRLMKIKKKELEEENKKLHNHSKIQITVIVILLITILCDLHKYVFDLNDEDSDGRPNSRIEQLKDELRVVGENQLISTAKTRQQQTGMMPCKCTLYK